MNKIMKQYNASLELANVIQLRSLSSYDTSKAETQKIAENVIENWSEKLPFHHVKVGLLGQYEINYGWYGCAHTLY